MKCQICNGVGIIYIYKYKRIYFGKERKRIEKTYRIYDREICCPECDGTGKDLDMI